MYIKSIVVDGFKSYAQRTEIGAFDPFFNAITGLNGSGKSNILDSICFVLGISNLSQVRASSLQELVYKHGQAGITKATVSVTFDNKDKSQSPLGYEAHEDIIVTRQVVIGGRNKYLINGVTAQNTRVQDLFRSVGLNVNNPHFLIMQGRITKVLNMKPPEILSMLEEAAGTRMYEAKKQAAQKTIDKKEAKLNEIQQVLDEEITPSLEKLKQERSSYLEYQKLVRECEHLSRLVIAHKVVVAEKGQVRATEVQKAAEEAQKAAKERLQAAKAQENKLEKELTELEAKKSKEGCKGLKEVENQFTAAQRAQAKAQSNLELRKQNLEAEEARQAELEKAIRKDEETLKERESKVKAAFEGLSGRRSDVAKLNEALAVAQARFQAVSAGEAPQGEGGSVSQLLMEAKEKMSRAESQGKQAALRVKHAQAELAIQEQEAQTSNSQYLKCKKNLEAEQAAREKAEAQIQKLSYTEGDLEKLHGEKRDAVKRIREMEEELEKRRTKFPQLHFDYKDPVRGWDRSRVKGLVASLITVKERATATALEVVAGGRLYNVVVDTEDTGKQLLEKGDLKRRCTIIPLNKIVGRVVNPRAQAAAQTLAENGNARLALSLVGYPSEIRAAMEFVFGSTFVCDSLDIARKVAFDKQVHTRAVTLDGDTFDPQGTLSGGARAQTTSVLLQLQELSVQNQELESARAQLVVTEQQLAKLEGIAKKYGELKQVVELHKQQEALHLATLQQSREHRREVELKTLQNTIQEGEQAAKEAALALQEAEKHASSLEKQLASAKGGRDRELVVARTELEECRERANSASQTLKDLEQGVDHERLELEEGKREVDVLKQQLVNAEKAFEAQRHQLSEAQRSLSQAEAVCTELQTRLAEVQAAVRAKDQEFEAINLALDGAKREISAAELVVTEVSHSMMRAQRDATDSGSMLKSLLGDNPWVKTERHLFGRPGSVYDFSSSDLREAKLRLDQVAEAKAKIGRNVNQRAGGLLEQAEERYSDLIRKKKIVENDRSKLFLAIEQLDGKKQEALNIAWQRVNKDFGSIFAALLPGSSARLAPPNNSTLLEGLEFHVALGNVWKENLSELSGGQRSLVALSLILAMLLFKPAPIYILDEVDAALDLSHTQNIGHMLRSHFLHSQFVVVSLKDGMFTNANVLFTTRFVDGISTVSRQQGSQILQGASRSARPLAKGKTKAVAH
uniref:structural maintenance of chromosomes protein 2 n=1 Tax=Myxine glutinosa TaxID=7769 RepID=UPI00358F90A9